MAVGGSERKLSSIFGPTVTMLSGVVTLLRALLRYPSSLGKELWRWTMAVGGSERKLSSIFGPTVTMLSGVVTLLRALLRYPSSLGKELWVKTLSRFWDG
uniref:Uncharacterized protein n=1 Tax=Oryza barthii TaxID=65489 RepID=A0A0D3F1R5_9ORYZ